MFQEQTVNLLNLSLSDLSLSSLKNVHYIAAPEKLSPAPGVGSKSWLHYILHHGHHDQVQVAGVGDGVAGAEQGWVEGWAWAGMI